MKRRFEKSQSKLLGIMFEMMTNLDDRERLVPIQ